MRGPNFTKLGEDIRRSSMLKVVSIFTYIAAFLNAGGSKSKMRENFALFDPTRNLAEGGRDLWVSYRSFTYDRTCGIHLIAVICAAAEVQNK